MLGWFPGLIRSDKGFRFVLRLLGSGPINFIEAFKPL